MVDVTLGTSKTIGDMTIGSSGESTFDGIPSLGGSKGDTTADRATAAVLGAAGIGTDRKWSTIGAPITVKGSGSRAATIAAIGSYDVQRTVLGASSAGIDIEFYVKNVTTGTSFKTTIFSKSWGIAGFSQNSSTFNQGLSVTLTGGHKYRIYVKLEAAISIAGIGEACADAGPQDGDDFNPPRQGVKLNDIRVQF